jgi:3-dehydroquinate synthase
MKTVHVDLGPRSYDVLIGRGLLDKVGELLKGKMKGPIAIISDNSVATLFAQRVEHQLTTIGLQPFRLTVPAGETSKSIEQVTYLLSQMAEKKVPRTGTVIGLGGGVVGDLAGFVAASYLRGVAFVQVPTSLLAMVDSSVGGKTGVNLPEGKNLVGAFYQPKVVIVDLDTLKTLPVREFAAGTAEVIKYGAIKDKALFDRVAKGVKPDDSDLDEIVEKCVAIKARIVEEDEFETKGQRALLNFGHTIGHAIEKATQYKTYLHGEAIALGMRAAAWLSAWQAGLPETEARQIEAALAANHLPLTLKAAIDRDAILSALGNDKKVAADGQNRWVLLDKLGKGTSGREVHLDDVKKAIELLYIPVFYENGVK